MTNLEQAIVAMNKVVECVSMIQRDEYFDQLDMMDLEALTSKYLTNVEMGTVDLEMLIGIEKLLWELQGICLEISDRNERRSVADMDSWYDTRYL